MSRVQLALIEDAEMSAVCSCAPLHQGSRTAAPSTQPAAGVEMGSSCC
jgi:hypothetical protein